MCLHAEQRAIGVDRKAEPLKVARANAEEYFQWCEAQGHKRAPEDLEVKAAGGPGVWLDGEQAQQHRALTDILCLVRDGSRIQYDVGSLIDSAARGRGPGTAGSRRGGRGVHGGARDQGQAAAPTTHKPGLTTRSLSLNRCLAGCGWSWAPGDAGGAAVVPS